jgi:hypothetical protein
MVSGLGLLVQRIPRKSSTVSDISTRSRLIATEYWPLPITSTTHLDIHRIYRNALFHLISREQLKADEARCQEWVEQNQDRQRQRGSFRNAPTQADGNLRAAMKAANLVQVADWERQQQEEEKRRLATTIQETPDAYQDEHATTWRQVQDLEMALRLQETEHANVSDMSTLISQEYSAFTVADNARLRQEEEDRQYAEALHASQGPSHPRTRQSTKPKLIRRLVSNAHISDAQLAMRLGMELDAPYTSTIAKQTTSDLSAERARYEEKKRKAKDHEGA